MDKLLVLKVGAEWCGACQNLKPRFDDMAKRYAENTNVELRQDDFSMHPVMMDNLGAQSIPTTLFIRNGKVIDMMVGALPTEEFEKQINFYLENEGTPIEKNPSSGKEITRNDYIVPESKNDNIQEAEIIEEAAENTEGVIEAA